MAKPDFPAGRILMVDDEPLLSQALMEILSLDGHEVVAVTSGHEALALIKRDRFDLIIIDYLMPEMRGDQLAALIKAQAPNQPVLMVSGLVEDLGRSGATMAGVDLVLGKPFTFDELRGAVAKALKAARLATEAGAQE